MTSIRPLLVRAIAGEVVERPPVWLMRQAGRYLPEYLALKEIHGFLGMCQSPELAAEVTLQPLRRFKVDAAIIFADIVLPFSALGTPIEFSPGPVIGNRITGPEDVFKLKIGDLEKAISYVPKAISVVAQALGAEGPERRALIGFAGAPYTLACYLIDQGQYKNFHGTQVFAQQHPKAFSQLLTILADLISDYLQLQQEAGADVVQLFDTWAGNLSVEDYRRWALPWSQSIIERSSRTPVTLYVNGSSHLWPEMAQTSANCIGLDWRTDLVEVHNKLQGRKVIQGNFDPALLFGSQAEVKTTVRSLLSRLGTKSGYIANLGHGVLPKTPPANVEIFVNTVNKGW